MIALKSLLTTGLLTAALGFAGTATASAHEGYDAQGNYVGTYTPGYNPAPAYSPVPSYAPAPVYAPAPAPVIVAPPPVVYCPPRPVVVYPRPYCGPVYPRYYHPYGHGHRDRFHLNIRW